MVNFYKMKVSTILMLLFNCSLIASPVLTDSGLVPNFNINARVCYLNINMEIIDTNGAYVYGRPINFIPNPKVAKFYASQKATVINEPFLAAAARINYIPFPAITVDGTLASFNYDHHKNLAAVYSNGRRVPLYRIER